MYEVLGSLCEPRAAPSAPLRESGGPGLGCELRAAASEPASTVQVVGRMGAVARGDTKFQKTKNDRHIP